VSGGGTIIEKRRMTLTDSDAPSFREDVVRYWLLTGESYDELIVYAKPQDDEPEVGERIWWGGAQTIFWGPDDKKQLAKVGYSISPEHMGKEPSDADER
jgi:hypothetical protein